jgi:predicted ester cyclase
MEHSMSLPLRLGIALGLVLMPYSISSAQRADHGVSEQSTHKPAISATASAERNKELIQNLFEGILNTGRFELLSQIVSDEFVGVSGQKGPAGFAAPLKAVRGALPDARWTLEDMMAEGDRVAVRWKLSGTHLGTFNGFTATQSPISNRGMGIFRIQNDKIVESWIETDRLGFLQQIGAIPQDPTALRPPAGMGAPSGRVE